MKKDTSVQVRKISEHRSALGAPEIGYEVEGSLLSDIVVGEAMSIYREKVNGVERAGIFTTSEILELEEEDDKTLVTTKNSTYEVIALSPTDPENLNTIGI